MATCGESYDDWPRTVITGGCLLMAFAPDGATGNDDDDDDDRKLTNWKLFKNTDPCRSADLHYRLAGIGKAMCHVQMVHTPMK